MPRDVRVYLTPDMIPPGALAGSAAVVVDVLRATSSMVTALASGARCVVPCEDIESARAAAQDSRWSPALLAGERGGVRIAGFDLGNSPAEFTAKAVKGKVVIASTTNGTRAILASRAAERVIVGAFLNFSAVCEQILGDDRPLRLVCSGTDGQPTLEDTLFAGAIIEHLSEVADVTLNDSARLAWDSFENHGRILDAAFEVSAGGENLLRVGLGADLKRCAAVDKFAIGIEARFEPARVEVVTAGIKRHHWPHETPGAVR